MNAPDIKLIEGKLLAIVWSMERDAGVGCHWRVDDLCGNRISWGYSKGRGGDGLGSRLTAMDNAKRAARRHIRKANPVVRGATESRTSPPRCSHS